MNFSEDLEELDRIWPLGKQLVVPDGGTVLVAGAYEGRYVDYICTRFKPGRVVGYEPQIAAADKATQRLWQHAPLANTNIHPVGIGVHDCTVSMENIGTDGCTVSSKRNPSVFGLVGIDWVLDRDGPFDLFICNMEGYEIPLLAYLCVTARLKEIKSLAVQFHKESNVPFLLTKVYGVPVYDDLPTWGYWRLDH